MVDKQNSKCLSSNAYTFDWSVTSVRILCVNCHVGTVYTIEQSECGPFPLEEQTKPFPQSETVKLLSNEQALFGKHLPVMHNVGQFSHHTNMCLTNIFCLWQNVLLKQCWQWWPNIKVCLISKILNVCQATFVRLAGA